jgi:hypothetical protein
MHVADHKLLMQTTSPRLLVVHEVEHGHDHTARQERQYPVHQQRQAILVDDQELLRQHGIVPNLRHTLSRSSRRLADQNGTVQIGPLRHVRVHQSRTDDSRRHSLVSEFLIDSLRERVDKGLARMVDCLLGSRRETSNRANVQNLTYAAIGHLFGKEMSQRHVSNDIENDHVDVVLQVAFENGAVSAGARIVDQVVDLKVVLLNVIKDLLSASHLAKIACDGMDFDAIFILDFALDRLERVMLMRNDDEVSALLGMVVRKSLADSTRGAGDES